MGLLPEGASLYDPAHITLVHHLYAALRAHALYFKDQHYVVLNDEIVIVDEFTGRMMTGRRWSDGSSIKALEAKEGVRIKRKSNFGFYHIPELLPDVHRLSGMTGTADTEAYEFQEIYGFRNSGDSAQ